MTALTIHIPVLETERLRLRPIRVDDFAAFASHAASPRSAFTTGRIEDFPTQRRIFGYLGSSWLLRGYGSFVLERKDSAGAIGFAGLWHPVGWPEPEIGWSIWDAAAEGKGYAYEAARACIADAFARDLASVVSYIHPDNARSIALAERLGAARDTAAAAPKTGDLVYRHPRPAA